MTSSQNTCVVTGWAGLVKCAVLCQAVELLSLVACTVTLYTYVHCSLEGSSYNDNYMYHKIQKLCILCGFIWFSEHTQIISLTTLTKWFL